MVEAVLFDVDGTLVDSVDLHAQAWQDAFAWYEKEIPFGEVRRQIGKGGDQLMPVFLTPQELEQFGEELSERRSKHYLRKYMPKVQPFPKAFELMKAIKDRGVRVALATSAKEEELKELKELVRADEVIDGQTTHDDVERSKPHPDIFLAALKQVGNPDPTQVIVIGDSPYDAEAGGKAGLKTIGLESGGFHPEDLLAAGCVALYRDPADLLEKLDWSVICAKIRGNGAHLA